MSIQKTQRQKFNSYWVMNSLGDKICPPAAPFVGPNRDLDQDEIVPCKWGFNVYVQVFVCVC